RNVNSRSAIADALPQRYVPGSNRVPTIPHVRPPLVREGRLTHQEMLY
ncbi:MAG: hypothetical protein QOJ59_463, partial [Thermomicrobiales bacterium]|nr:hypothetical protein [Thermomicrobiales bacterium]